MPRPRTWTDDDLRTAVAASASLHGVFAAMGLAIGGSQWLTLQGHIHRLGLDTSHWTSPLPAARPRGRRRTWTDDELRAAVEESRSYAAVMRLLNVRGGGAHRVVRERIEALDLDIGHFTGQGWSRGLTNPLGRQPRPLDEILVRGSDHGHTANLRERLIAEGLKEARCEGCGHDRWRGRDIPLQLDHVNGDRRDHRLSNLRILCPNCHAQTDTYCGRNRGRYAAGASGDV